MAWEALASTGELLDPGDQQPCGVDVVVAQEVAPLLPELAADLRQGGRQPHAVHQPRRDGRRPARTGRGTIGQGVRRLAPPKDVRLQLAQQ